MSDLFPPDEKHAYGESQKHLRTLRRIEATYDYRDERGDFLFQCVRFVPKDFKQRRLSPEGNWVWNLEGVRRVLFHLQKLLATPRAPVLVVEGEKDVLNLEALGYVATTCPCGSGAWSDDYAECLRGRRVVVLPDNDDAGMRFASRVVGSLVLGGAASVRVVSLPVAIGEDVSDWLAADPKRDHRTELARLVLASPKWAAEPCVVGGG